MGWTCRSGHFCCRLYIAESCKRDVAASDAFVISAVLQLQIALVKLIQLRRIRTAFHIRPRTRPADKRCLDVSSNRTCGRSHPLYVYAQCPTMTCAREASCTTAGLSSCARIRPLACICNAASMRLMTTCRTVRQHILQVVNTLPYHNRAALRLLPTTLR